MYHIIHFTSNWIDYGKFYVFDLSIGGLWSGGLYKYSKDYPLINLPTAYTNFLPYQPIT